MLGVVGLDGDADKLVVVPFDVGNFDAIVVVEAGFEVGDGGQGGNG